MAYPTLVDSIDEGDEPPGQISRSMRHARDPCDDKSMIGPHQLEIIRGASGSSHQLIEFEHRSVSACFRDFNVPSPDLMGSLVRRIALDVPKESKPLVGVTDRSFVHRVMVDTRRRPGNLSVIGSGVEVDDTKACLEQVDTRNERGALDAVLV